jgi:hypothetical protein
MSAFFGVKFHIVVGKKKKIRKSPIFQKVFPKILKISRFVYMVQVGSKTILG